MKKYSLTMSEQLYDHLKIHLFPGDGDEHGAAIAAGIVETPNGVKLLARKLFIAVDGTDYVPGKHGYRALTTDFIIKVTDYCEKNRLCYLPIHCHGGDTHVSFSSTDMKSHKKGYPALLDILDGAPVGALVFAKNAIAGDIWTREGRHELSLATVVGTKIKKLYPQPADEPIQAEHTYDRHALLFGDLGQEVLTNLKVGIIGLGGGGSLINEQIARLGVGHIVGVDYDKIDITNLPRIVGSNNRDAMSFLTRRNNKFLLHIGKKLARNKVKVAKRVARIANPKIKYDAIVGNILDEQNAKLLRDVDFIFLAADNMQARLVFNALVHQYLIPGAQVGAKVSVNKETRIINNIHVASRVILPFSGFGGCLECHELISPEQLANEALTEHERESQKYVDDKDIHAPSVITLNNLSVAPVVNDLMMMFTGLYEDDVKLSHLYGHITERNIYDSIESLQKEQCPDCSTSDGSRYAMGDLIRLPCRIKN